MRKTGNTPIVWAGLLGAAAVALLAALQAGLVLLGQSHAWHFVAAVVFGGAAGVSLAFCARRHRVGSPPSARRQIPILPDPKGCAPVPVRVFGPPRARRPALVLHRRALRRSG